MESGTGECAMEKLPDYLKSGPMCGRWNRIAPTARSDAGQEIDSCSDDCSDSDCGHGPGSQSLLQAELRQLRVGNHPLNGLLRTELAGQRHSLVLRPLQSCDCWRTTIVPVYFQ